MEERRKMERREKRQGSELRYVLYGVFGAFVGGPIFASHGWHGVVVVVILVGGLWTVWKLLKYAFKKPPVA
jgi:hypothetical protein